MGVPKFFRYMSERYPCLSEVIKEYQIPEFDNLYLDMNGIIHNCSHPNDFDPHFRITERQIFQDIFHYLEVLFRIIQPKQLFFMAIDGVAPRAKMNQQRGRRFRSAKEAEDLEEKAKLKGETLPKEKRFDSNCITPGTPFMCRLHAQLRYFVKLKMTTDKLWKNTKVILSGHETPGEGEHKIMDYIRYMKSKPDYNPNLRHCLYGLDADLIMLGLCTHEPYFSLLREEVKFNQSSNKGGSKILTPEETKFFLLHLSLMRDYLELEFEKISKPGVLPFPFDIEKVIDDWVLMGFLVGNDFLPNLPDLHIIDGALPLMYKVYQETLPTLDGYINEAGYLNLKRFEKFMQKLASFDFEHFREKMADIQYIEGKTGRKFKDVFTKEVSKNMDSDLAALIKATDDEFDFRDDELDEVLNYADYREYYYSDEDDEWRSNFFAEFSQHKTDYYRFKLDYSKVTNDVLRDQAECYIRAIQWNLHYYYNGCASWSWYYPHHYAPYISDIKDFCDLKLTYELGEPFLPFQQLLAVLPAASKDLLPKPFQNLMTLENSPILDFYPTEFQTDLNGKKQEWEAVVLIPFIDEKKLIEAMDSVEHQLTEEERSRNRHGPMLMYTHSEHNLGTAEAPEYFPPIENNHAMEVPLWRDQIYVHHSKLVKGLCKNVNLNLFRTKFPTLKHLNFTSKIENIKVKVFQQPSRNESVVLTLENPPTPSISLVADQILGRNILVNYPHLFEIKVVSVFSKNARISLDKDGKTFLLEENTKSIGDMFQLCRKSATDDYYSKQGIVIGDTDIMITGQPVESQKYVFGPNGKVTQRKMYIRSTINFPFQTAVLDSTHQPKHTLAFKSIDDIFYRGCQCYTLSNPYYGSEGTVISTVKGENTFVKLSLKVQQEPDLSEISMLKDQTVHNYMPGYTIASKLSVTPLLLSRITGSIFILTNIESDRKVNVGLNIKFNKKNEEVVGFTKRDENTKKWFYTDKVVLIIRRYMELFPEVFQLLRNKSMDDIYMRDEVFPTNGEERLNQLVAWLKEQEHTKAEVRNCGASVVDEHIVSMIEKEIESCEGFEKQMSLLVKPNKLYIPKPILDKVAPDPDTKFLLFDRVVNVRDCYTVPLGYRGTIIGITQGDTSMDTVYDVLFDKPFPHGIKLRCSDSRGYRLPGQAMINITHGERFNSNNNPSMKNLNVMKSRVDRNSSYSNAARQLAPLNQQPKKINVSKENSSPPNPNHLMSPFYNHKPPLSQQSSPGSNVISRQSPISADTSEKPSPARDVSHLPVHFPADSKATKSKTPRELKKSSVEEVAVTINKEERCIFSVPTFPIPTAQPMATMSFFGPSNILDRPEIQNKLFKESDSQKSSRGHTPNHVADVVQKPKDEVNYSVATSANSSFEDLNSSVQRMRSRTTSRTVSESSENIVCIPSISDLVKQNNITAKTDFRGENRSLQDFICKMQSPDLSLKQPSNSKLFDQAICAMAKQSPQLLEGKSVLNKEAAGEIDLDFSVKHAPVGTSCQPTIKTEMRKIVKSTSNQQFEDSDEEEVMIIEVKDEKSREAPSDAYSLQAFFSKLKVNDAKDAQNLLRDKKVTSLEHIEASVATPTSVATSSELTSVTSKTINDFFAKEVQKIKAKNEAQKEVSLNDVPEKPIARVNVLSESRVHGTDMLKKMLNVDHISPASSLTPSPVLDDASKVEIIPNVEQSTVSSVQKLFDQHSSNLQTNLTTPSQRLTPSAFKSVTPKLKDGSTSNAPVQNTISLNQSASLPVTKPLSASAPSFIPPQVQKYHFDKIPLSAQSRTAPLQPGSLPSFVPGAPLVQGQQPFVLGCPVQPTNQPYAPAMVPFQSAGRGVALAGQAAHSATPHGYYNQPQYPNGFTSYPNYMGYTTAPPVGQFPAVPPSMYPNRQQILVSQPPLPSKPSAQLVGAPLQQASTDYQGFSSAGQPVYYSNWKGKSNQAPHQLYQHPFPQAAAQQTNSQFTSQPTGFRVKPLPQQCPQPSWSQPSNPMTSSTESVSDEKVDSFVLKLLQLTKHNKLGTPAYSYEIDDASSYTAVVRIAHPHSEIMVRGKPCSKKSDSAEICARRAFNELAQVYTLPVPKNKSKEVTSDAPAVAPTSTAKADSEEIEKKEEKKEEKKTKRPKLAAKFNVSLHSKN